MAIITSGQLTLTDLNDSKQILLYLNGNYKTQVYDSSGTFAPNFTTQNLVITPELFIAGGDGSNLLPSTDVQSVKWYEGSQTTTALAENGTGGTTPGGYTYTIPTGAVASVAKPLTIKSNITGNSQIYTCVIVYRDPGTGFDNTIKASYEIVRISNGTNALQVILSNESASVPTDQGGGSGIYSATGTEVRLFEGATELTYDGAGTTAGTWKMTAAGTGITAGTVTDGGTQGVLGVANNITTDAATVLITITGKRLDGTAISLTKTQTITRIKAGQNPTSYWLLVDASAVQKAASGAYTPATINITGKSQVGTATPGAYTGVFTVEEDVGAGYVNKYTTAAPATGESSRAYAVSTAGIKSIRIRMYLLGGTTNLLDEQVIPVVSDGTQTVVATLSNEAVTIATDQSRGNGIYTGSGTDIHVYDGASELTFDPAWTTANGGYKVTAAASGIAAGSITKTGVYAVVGVANTISADQATVTYTITGKSLSGAAFTLTKVQVFSAAKTGVAPTAYWMTLSSSVIQKNVAGAFNPTSLTITGMSQTGGAAPSSTAIFKFRTDVDTGAGFVTGTATGALASTTYSSFPANLKAVRFRLYPSAVTPNDTNFIDEAIVTVVSDGATGIDAYFLNVWAPNGDTTRNSAQNLVVQADMYKGAGTVVPTAYKWYSQDSTATVGSGGDADGQAGWRLINTVANPTTAPTLAVVPNTNTRLTATTYFVKYTWCGLAGETIGSSEASLLVAANNDLRVTIPAFGANVTMARVYIGTATGVLFYAGDITTSAGNIVITAFSNTSEAIPTATTASAVTGAQLTVRPWAIPGVEGFKCVATAPVTGVKYTGITVLRDVQDPIMVNIMGANIFKNGEGSVTLTAQLLQAGVAISTAGYTFDWSLYTAAGGLLKVYPVKTPTITISSDDVTGTANLVVDVNR